jgi:Gpi18-like mannosyltransferase
MMKRRTDILFTVLAFAFILSGMILRIAGLGLISLDMKAFVMRWYDQLARQGFSALQTGFSNYTPPYLYLLWIATLTRDLLPEVTAIKLISILFDAGNAVWVYKIARIKYVEGPVPFLGAAIFFTLPTIFLNSAWWGQADSIYTFFILASFYFLLREHSLPAMIFFGIAISFKFQAVFFAPFLFLLTLKHRIAWTHTLIIPFVYITLMIPAVLAGRSFLDTLMIYLTQADTFRQLTMNAPNLYQFISNNWYELGLMVGLGFTVLLVLFWAIGYAHKIKAWTPEIQVICATVSAVMMPFFLPKMHERYFYIADVMILLLVVYLPRLWVVLLTSQVVSTITYSLYLFAQNSPRPAQVAPTSPLLILAALINTLLVSFLFWKQHGLIEKGTLTFTL